MELTWSHPLHGSVEIIAKTVVKTVGGLSNMVWAGFHRLGTGHNMIKTYGVGTNLKFKQGLKVRKMAS
jgi:hypothetical protein